MDKRILALISAVIEKLQSFHLRLKSKYQPRIDNNNFSPLSPIANADKDKHYANALTWALQTRHENYIRNIAITGPYGSGKSSVLKTFQNNYKSKDLSFLNISLATFKEEILENDESDIKHNVPVNDPPNPAVHKKKYSQKSNSEDVIRLIELSILQQIFYHADDSEIPESRFRKLKRINKWAIRWKSLAILLFVLSLSFLWRSSLPNAILNVLNEVNIGYFYSVALLYLLGLTYLLAFCIQTGQKEIFNVKLPVMLVGINLLLLLYVTFNEIMNWEPTIPPLTGTIIISRTLDALALIYVSIFSLFALYNLLQQISRITVNKLKFQDAEIEIDTKISKSILNHHLDEILYFFEATSYNVVVIEDLDRFQQTEIFTKLREINLFLNNSKKTKHKEIVFIYAVRDDMFTDKERSKFFDFIIPIIPVINSTNSSQQLSKKNTKYEYGWSEDLIDSLSIFIDDMRLLHNICNEFEIYKNKLTEKLDQNKLLAILVYKNLFPNDFSKLNNNEGDLWNTINSKQDFISKEVNEIKNEIDLYTPKIERLEELKIVEVQELRQLYLIKYIDKFDRFKSFRINSSSKTLAEMCLDENFDYLTANNATYDSFVDYSHQLHRLQLNQSIDYKFDDIENEVNPNKSYTQRLKEITDWHLGKTDTLREKIQGLEQKMIKIRRSKIKDVLSTTNIPPSTWKGVKQNKLINVLLRNGYIDEDYHDFMSIFYEGNLTKSDNDFLISVKSQEQSEFTYQLSKIEALVKKIHPLDFEQPYTLNNSLVTFLLNNSVTYKEKLEHTFEKLKDKSETSINFITNYIDNGEELEKFINKISHIWDGFWKHIEVAPNVPDKKKDIYFKYILLYAAPSDILVLSENSEMSTRIAKDKSFLSLIPDIIRMKEILQTLDVDFHDLDFDKSPEELLTYVYENWNYKITVNNISNFVKKYGEFDQKTFDTSNYMAIMSSNCEEVISYINNNLDDYIENVYLKIDSNVLECEEYLIELLNNEKLSTKLKTRIISKTNTIVEVLQKVKSTAQYKTLLTENKIASKWNNILCAYINLKADDNESNYEDNLPKEVVEFLNVIENSEKLSQIKTPTEGDLSPSYKELWRAMIYAQEIKDDHYRLITKSCPWWYTDLDYKKISESKTKILIDNSCVSPVQESYEAIKSALDGVNIYLVEKYKTHLLKLIDEIQFDSSDLELILKSTLLTSSEKFEFLNGCEIEVIQTRKNLKLVTSLLVANESLTIKEDILDSILLESTISSEERRKLFIRNRNRYDNEFIEKFINTLDVEFAKINEKTIKAKIPKTVANKAFLDVLQNKGYISSFSEAKRSNDYRVHHKRN